MPKLEIRKSKFDGQIAGFDFRISSFRCDCEMTRPRNHPLEDDPIA